MIKWTRYLGFTTLVLAVCLAIFIPATTWMHRQVKNAQGIHDSRMAPIILVPGSSATQNRFNSLVTTLNQRTQGHSKLLVTVKTDGTLTTQGHIAPRDFEPYIVIAFENNQDGYNNIKKQAKWFSLAFNELSAKYHFNHFNAIGHSNGGLILTLFLTKYAKQSAVTMNKLMTIGTPYNLEESNSHNRTQMLTDLIKARNQLPKSLTVYSLAGTQTYDDDGIVPLASVECGKYIFQHQVKHYTQITVSGDQANHSDLPQNQEIEGYIQQYMLTQPNQAGVHADISK
ncbi:alpha/beta hydrolase [Lacticaseibacillus porcinae]|uniref:alpha/beta hydrolase n=1 Tax=Lacticaseibacillus porcinae TaxID=1123687 RepID=UPI000F7669B9